MHLGKVATTTHLAFAPQKIESQTPDLNQSGINAKYVSVILTLQIKALKFTLGRRNVGASHSSTIIGATFESGPFRATLVIVGAIFRTFSIRLVVGSGNVDHFRARSGFLGNGYAWFSK